VAVLGLLAFLTIGGLGGPRIDVESPRSILMDARDFDFDMVNDSDSAGFLDGDYRFFGADCSPNLRIQSLLGSARIRSEVAYTSGESLYQYIEFDQALLELPSADDAQNLVDELRAGANNESCGSDYESISTRYYGETTLETFGYELEDSIVYYGETVIDSLVLEATVRRVYVGLAQDESVLVIDGSLDASMSDVSFGEMERAVQYAVDKAFEETN
jgi:hypothetical protein